MEMSRPTRRHCRDTTSSSILLDDEVKESIVEGCTLPDDSTPERVKSSGRSEAKVSRPLSELPLPLPLSLKNAFVAEASSCSFLLSSSTSSLVRGLGKRALMRD